MEDTKKTKTELIKDLNKLRIQLAGFNSCEEERRQLQESLQKALHELHFDSTQEISKEHFAHTLKVILKEFTRVIQSSREQFRSIIEKSADGVIIVDRQGIVRFFNPAAEKLFGRSAKDMTGNLFGFPLVAAGTAEIEIITDKKGLRFAEMRVVPVQWENEQAYLASIRDITQRRRIQESIQKAHDELEQRVQERTQELSEAVELLEKEIVQRRQSQEEMRQMKEKYENLIENIPDAIYSVLPDEKNTTIFMSERWKDWTGFMPEDFYKDPDTWLKSIHQDNRDEALNVYRKSCKSDEEYLFEYRVVHKDTGKELFLKDHGVPIKDKDGKVIRFDGIVTNITEQKKLQKQLIQAEKLATVGQLASSVSHELRNPLNVIGSSIYYLKSKMKDLDEKVIKHLKILQKEVNRAYCIISNILDFSKNQVPVLLETNINSIVLDSLSSLDVPKEISVIKDFTDTLPLILLDPDLMRHIFDNLIINAYQAMPKGGTLEIKTISRENFIEIIFKDNGKGISQENLDKIFDPLFTTRTKGIGLGLAIVKDIVGRYGGHIDVESTINKGTTFTVTIPLERGRTASQ